MFSTQEKTQAQKFPDGIVKLTSGVDLLSSLFGTRAHTALRPTLKNAMFEVTEVWRLAALWFSGLSGTTIDGAPETRSRAVVLQESQDNYNAMLAAFDPLLVATGSASEFSAVDVAFKNARATLSGFNWGLGYQNPFHEDDATTPFTEPKTVVGPHGDWPRATASLMQGALKIVDPWRDMLEIYIGVPVYNEIGNNTLHLQFRRFGNMINKLSRVWAMHIEVETAADAAIISADVAAGQRSRSFMRTILQTELMYTTRLAFPANFRGRNMVRGISDDIRQIFLNQFVIAMARSDGNGKPWVRQLVETRVLGNFNSGFSEFWMMLDAWSQAAFGFYHPLPDPTKFKPVTPDGSQTGPGDPPPSNPSVIPLGEFDSEVAQIAAAKAAVGSANAQLDMVLANLRGREGAEI